MSGPDTIHPEYTLHKDKWKRCRDVFAGQDAVHFARDEYLPKLKDQRPDEYQAYVMRTPFYNASARTSDALTGMVFRTQPIFQGPEALRAMLDDVTLSGIEHTGFSEAVVREVLDVGRCGVLVEFPRVTEAPSNAAQAAARNLRPYATIYKAESIINWRIERINNKMQPTMVVLAETYEKRLSEFASEMAPQIRALMLVDGIYTQRIYRQSEGGKSNAWELVEEIFPTMGGAPMRELPFFPFGPHELSLNVQEPPLLDLVDINLSHYRTTADLEHGAHFTGLPTPVVSGYQPMNEGERLYIGSTAAWVFPDPNAKASFLEFTGQGLQSLEKLLDRKEHMMAALGARMLAPEKRAAEAEGTVAMRHNGEYGVLTSIAMLCSIGLEEVYEFMARWAGIAGDVTYRLNSDYFPARLTPQELQALVMAWQQGAISYDTLFTNLKEGEIIAAEVTVEEEQTKIGDTGPSLAE